MSLINPFDPWRSKLCTCPVKYNLSAYIGCSHNCLYCYASSYIKNFHIVREKKNFLKHLNKEIKKTTPGTYITLTNSSDPYVSLENKLKLTQTALKILKNYDLKINLITKSTLIIRDLEILKDFKNLFISISLTTLKNNLAKKIEPSAPSPLERLKTIEKLSKYIPTCCRIDPLIYPLNTSEIKNLVTELKNRGIKQIITSTYKVKPDNFKRMLQAFPQYKTLWQKLYYKKGERIGSYMYLQKDLRLKLIEETKEIAIGQNLEFSSCREGFSKLNTTICDGSSLLKF